MLPALHPETIFVRTTCATELIRIKIPAKNCAAPWSRGTANMMDPIHYNRHSHGCWASARLEKPGSLSVPRSMRRIRVWRSCRAGARCPRVPDPAWSWQASVIAPEEKGLDHARRSQSSFQLSRRTTRCVAGPDLAAARRADGMGSAGGGRREHGSGGSERGPKPIGAQCTPVRDAGCPQCCAARCRVPATGVEQSA